MIRADIVAEARKWLGVPYRKKGRTRAGIDCIGLSVMLAIAFDVPHRDDLDYTDWPDPTHRMLRVCRTYLNQVPARAPLAGLIGAFTQARLPGHVAVFSDLDGHTHMIHARMDVRRVIEQIYRPQDREARLIATFALPGLED